MRKFLRIFISVIFRAWELWFVVGKRSGIERYPGFESGPVGHDIARGKIWLIAAVSQGKILTNGIIQINFSLLVQLHDSCCTSYYFGDAGKIIEVVFIHRLFIFIGVITVRFLENNDIVFSHEYFTTGHGFLKNRFLDYGIDLMMKHLSVDSYRFGQSILQYLDAGSSDPLVECTDRRRC